RLRTPMDVVVTSVEQVTFSEFVLSLAAPCAAFVFKVDDRHAGQGAIDLGNELAFHLVDRLFGGPGEPSGMTRAITALEQGVVKAMAERMLGLLRDAWQDQLAMTPAVVGFESDREMLQIANREDHVLVACLEVLADELRGLISLCLPMATLETF